MNIPTAVRYAVGVTVVCLIQVTQQVELVKVSYELRGKEQSVQDLIDRHRVLVYNNLALSSPQQLTKSLAQLSSELTQADPGAVAYVRIDPVPSVRASSARPQLASLDFWVPQAEAAPQR